jgi:tetratricopeptide (TPR) repeat protein
MRWSSRVTVLAAGLVLCLSAFSQTVPDQRSEITAALRAGEFDRALQILHPALKQAPDDPRLWTLQALAYSGEGHKKEALTSFQNALKISPDYLPALEGAAQLQYEAGNSAAVPLLQRILRARPNDPTTHAMLAVMAYKRGDCAEALQQFDESGPLASSQPEVLGERGTCMVKLKQFDQALAAFTKILASNSSDYKVRCQLATVQLMAERPKDAIATLAPLLQASDPPPNVLQLASSAYEANGDTPNAVRTLRQAIIEDPRNTDLYLDFADLSMNHQSFQVGIDVINSGLQLQPKAAPLYVARGVLYVQLAQYDKAEADFEKANSLDPRASLGSVAQGLEAIQSSDPDRALATVRAKLAKKPNDPYLLYLQADVLTQKGVDPGTAEFERALNSAKRAVVLQPSLSAARDVLAKLYLQAGQNRLAIEQCRKALDTDPMDQTAVYHLIQGLRKTGATNEIPGLLKRLAELRAESTKEEGERNRYKLVEQGSGPGQPLQR